MNNPKRFLAPIVSVMILSVFFAPLFALAVDGGLVPCGTSANSSPCTICHLFQGIQNIINFIALQLAMPLAVAVMIYGGFLVITSAGNSGKVTKGWDAIKSAVFGVIIVLGGWLIVDTILRLLITGELGGGNFEIRGWGPWNDMPC